MIHILSHGPVGDGQLLVGAEVVRLVEGLALGRGMLPMLRAYEACPRLLVNLAVCLLRGPLHALAALGADVERQLAVLVVRHLK